MVVKVSSVSQVEDQKGQKTGLTHSFEHSGQLWGAGESVVQVAPWDKVMGGAMGEVWNH